MTSEGTRQEEGVRQKDMHRRGESERDAKLRREIIVGKARGEDQGLENYNGDIKE